MKTETKENRVSSSSSSNTRLFSNYKKCPDYIPSGRIHCLVPDLCKWAHIECPLRVAFCGIPKDLLARTQANTPPNEAAIRGVQ